MERRMRASEMMEQLRNEKVNTWFDLGLFIDRMKLDKPTPSVKFKGDLDDFYDAIGKGIAFITFYYSIDGVTIEVEKYAKVFKELFDDKIPVHYIAGQFYPEADKVMDALVKRFELPAMHGFDKWNLYNDFFNTKLERGSRKYNALIKKFWTEILHITEHLGKYVEDNDISLLYLINVASNPGNVSLAVATVLVSEYLGIPVINNNHDFYFEGGSSVIDQKAWGTEKGPRDFYFKNFDIGEFFSQIDVFYPWESRSWLQVNINNAQSKHLTEKKGINPANVTEIGTSVDVERYQNISKRKKIDAFVQFEQVFSHYSDVLVTYSVDDVIKSNLVTEKNPRPVLISNKTKTIDSLVNENIIVLQPTRVISRKRIELGFELIRKLFKREDIRNKFEATPSLQITFLITGPIPLGQFGYFKQLLKEFKQLLKKIPEQFQDKILLGFLFSEIDKENFKKRFAEPIGIPELYNIASLIMLPSETEGRGLPIIEAAATGIPIYCSRYTPENVYAEVIGEHLTEDYRLKVIEFSDQEIKDSHIDKIVDRVFAPHKFFAENKHNKKVVERRYSNASLKKNMKKILKQLYVQLKPNDRYLNFTLEAMKRYEIKNSFTNDDLKYILNTENRHYLPGFGRLNFMHFLKALIDPSFFRVEEQRAKGIALSYAKELIDINPKGNEISNKLKATFFNAVDNIFHYRKGEIEIRHDHSFSYRHRNKDYYPYQKYTFQELTGLINMLYMDIINPKIDLKVEQSSHFFTDWNLALQQLTTSSHLEIDDRELLVERLKSNVPIAYFPGAYVKYELEFFALQSVRARLGLPIEVELKEEMLDNAVMEIQPIYVFAQRQSFGRWANAENLKDYLLRGKDRELKLLYDRGIIKIIETDQYCVGIHFAQLGEEALHYLCKVKDNKGYMITQRLNAAVMTDYVDIDRFHIGHIKYKTNSNIMGIPVGSGYIQFVPAGVRTTLAYPTPIQTAKDFSELLKSDLFKRVVEKHGKTKVFDEIRKDAENNGSPLKLILERLDNDSKEKDDVEYNFVSGVYADGYPWNGAMAKVNLATTKNKWMFAAFASTEKTKRVTTFIDEFTENTGKKAKIGWNGGYILNAELVGKLGLPESYIGSPLGLLISDNKMVCPPLFNKPALLIADDGSIDIRLVNSSRGISADNVTFPAESYNSIDESKDLLYYDLLHKEEKIPGNGRVIVRIAGNVIKEIKETKKGEKISIIPVGLTLSFKKSTLPSDWKVNKELQLSVAGIDNVKHAVEAGPFIVNNNEFSLDMEHEGWKTQNSIRTQAARLDFTDMRGPKIAVGIDKENNLYVLTINGRIRESVGATHIDMAEIMLKFGMEKAMGFDPGGSSTLVVNGEVLNISPYNHKYEENIYALPPEPRAVANAVLGWIEE